MHDTSPSGKPVKDFVCQICSKGFTRRSYLESHLATHVHQNDGRPAKYSNEFKSQAVEEAHQIGVLETAKKHGIGHGTLRGWIRMVKNPFHTEEKVDFPLCGKTYASSKIMNVHMKGVHLKELKEIKATKFCETCGKNFLSQSQLDIHQVTH